MTRSTTQKTAIRRVMPRESLNSQS